MATQYLKKYILSKPGINRDGTSYDSEYYIDGQHVRFYQSKPRKIGGYSIVSPGNTEIVRGLSISPYNAPQIGGDLTVLVYIGRPSSVGYQVINTNSQSQPFIDRTPPLAFTPNPNNVWTFDYITTTVLLVEGSYVIAHVNPNGNDLNGDNVGILYYGLVNDPSPLKEVAVGANSSGGFVIVGDIIVSYGSDGFISWNTPGDILDWTNARAVTNTKIVAGIAAESQGQTALLWTVDSLIKITYDPDNTDWVSTIISNTTSILSPNVVVFYNSVYYWLGQKQFYTYTGVVQELPNTLNRLYLTENINIAAREKAFAIVIPDWNEIWWFVPLGDATENNHAFIYNYALNTWYDTGLSRSSGVSPGYFPYPILSSSESTPDGSIAPPPGQLPEQVYPIWLHEFGTDMSMWGENYAIPSFFETNMFTFFENSPENDYQIVSQRIEPDFLQNGNMALVINNRAYPRSTPSVSISYNFAPEDEKIDVNTQGRIVSYQFTSNEAGGFYQMGKVVLNYKPGDQRPGS